MRSADKFRELRFELGLSQFELAKLLSIKQSTYSNYETGKRNASLRVCYRFIKLANLKGIHISLEDLRPDE